MVDQVVERMFERAGEQLPFKIDSDEPWAGLDLLVLRHPALHMQNHWSLVIPFGSQHNANMNRLFLHRRWEQSLAMSSIVNELFGLASIFHSVDRVIENRP